MNAQSPPRVRRFAPLAALAVALSLALGACSLERPAPVKNTFLLDPALPAPASVKRTATLRIGPLNVAAPYRDRTFVYRTGELKFESDFYHEFFVPPAAMIGQLTARALERASVFARVVPFGSAPEQGDYVLEGFVSDLYADARQRPTEAVVGITFYLTRTAFPSTVVWSKAYHEREALDQGTPEGLANAWNRALARVFAGLARDLAAPDLAAH